MQLKDFDYELPDELIARYPTAERSASRLLCLNRQDGQVQHKHFFELIDFLNSNDLLVFNNTKVIKARMFGQKETGGKVEILIERILKDKEVLAHVRASKSPKEKSFIYFTDEIKAEVLGRNGDLFHLNFHSKKNMLSILDKVGHIPLPPYIDRADELTDTERYQTVYAKVSGSVAAPTAGLHFDETLLEKIKAKGLDCAYVTLHVGAGTFQPVRAEDITQHKMHAELIDVNEEVCEKIKKTKERGGRIIAVGTTTVRCLETASRTGSITPYQGETDIFIYPGFKFNCIDAMVTNFHLPQSSLLMLISAFAGYETIKNTYAVAIKEKYRFFSYGDAMFIY